ncbi:MAG: FAD-dependent oxidoreductase [Clostridia bacterium]|nr:FAD-dependent oxidoreductase [Clostridia bacterium]
MQKKILILGAGYAGIEAALTLQKARRKTDDYEITIIDKNPYHTLLTELHEVAGNRINKDGIIVPLKEIFKYTDVKIIQDEITHYDFEKKLLISSTKKLSYDYLIIAAGSQPNFYGIPGLKENSFTLWSFQDAVKIREHIKETFLMAAQETDPEKRKALLTFIIGGGGFTGVEMTGELALWVKSLCREHHIPKDDVKIILVEAMPNILNNLKAKNIEKSMKYLTKKLKVDVRLNCAISKVNPDSVELKNGVMIPSFTLIWTAGIRAAEIGNNLCTLETKGCRIKVNEYTQTEYKNVYAVGDIAAFHTGSFTLPAMVETALQTGKAAAKNILADLRGKEKEKLKPKLHGVMVSIGSYFAVSDIMGRQLPRYLSILMKYLVNMHYLFGIGGFELVIRYIKHEFLHKKQDKTILEDHCSATTPNFWLLPIRLFLGYSWLMEGINKLNEGWFTKPMLSSMVTDTATSASVTTAAEKALKLSIPFYSTIFENVVIPNQVLFQKFIILSELGLGLAFITGSFTFIAALVSVGLNINFILSTGMYLRELWYIPSALCLLGGAGRAFGVDYYLIPYLMRQWRYVVRNRMVKLWLFR